MKSPLVSNAVLLLIAIIWGFGFVPQRLGMEYLGPMAFNALRFSIGALSLVPILMLFRGRDERSFFNRSTLCLGLLLGGLLFGGATFQQISIQYTSLANVAFITGLYVIIVPMIGFFIGYKYALITWFGGVVAIVGLYLMTGSNSSLAFKGDLLALLGALFWAMHLLLLAKRASEHNQMVLSFHQFVYCALFSCIAAFMVEDVVFPSQAQAYFWPMVNGVIVVGLAYTLQVLVMPHAEPFSASLILSLEAVFGALAGYFIFSEQLTNAAVVGAVMMLFGCLLAQLPSSNEQLSADI